MQKGKESCKVLSVATFIGDQNLKEKAQLEKFIRGWSACLKSGPKPNMKGNKLITFCSLILLGGLFWFS